MVQITIPPSAHLKSSEHSLELKPNEVEDFSSFRPSVASSSPLSLCPVPSWDGSELVRSCSNTPLLPPPATSSTLTQSRPHHRYSERLRSSTTDILRTVLDALGKVLLFALAGLLWSCIGGFLGWGIMVTSAPYSSASDSGVLLTSSLGGTIIGAAIGLCILAKHWYEIARTHAMPDEACTNSGSCSTRRAGNGHSGHHGIRTLLSILAVGIFGQCVGVAVLHSRCSGTLDTDHALRASALGELAVMPLLIIALANTNFKF